MVRKFKNIYFICYGKKHFFSDESYFYLYMNEISFDVYLYSIMSNLGEKLIRKLNLAAITPWKLFLIIMASTKYVV